MLWLGIGRVLGHNEGLQNSAKVSIKQYLEEKLQARRGEDPSDRM
jgi:hypothetical protein